MCQARGRVEVAVQDKRVKIGAVWPHDSSQLIVHADLGKEVRIGKRLEHWAVQLSGQVDVS